MRHNFLLAIHATIICTAFSFIFIVLMQTTPQAPQEDQAEQWETELFSPTNHNSTLTILDKPNKKIEAETTFVIDQVQESQSSVQKIDPSSMKKYEVLNSDTLMLIAFQYYSDYSRWRDIYHWNKKNIRSGFKIVKGQTLKLYGPFKKYQRPLGSPYLIKEGDYLAKISRKVYGDAKEWKTIWQNNSFQIRDPNLIFAGFMLFYPELISPVIHQLH